VRRRDDPVHAVVLIEALLWQLPRGRNSARPAQELARALGISTRTLQSIVGEAIDRGNLIGSICSGDHGYFLIQDAQDLDVGTAHIRARALSSLKRCRKLERAAADRFGPEAARLFDLEATADA
jgi:hypothetical protein